MPQSEHFVGKDGEKGVTETVTPVDSDLSEKQPEDPQWVPGFFTQFPTVGFAALCIAVLCAVAEVVALLVSNGKSEKAWPQKLAPNVVISGLNGIANICISMAIGNGIAITWWRQALKGATIEQLHKSWSFSTSFKEVFLAGKYFNIIALTALTAKLTIVDNMLMQRATSTATYQGKPRNATNLYLYANESIAYTGTASDSTTSPGFLVPEFNQDLFLWDQNGGLAPFYGSGCNGLCFVAVPAAGFEFNCTAPVVTDINYGNDTMEAFYLSTTQNGSTYDNTTQKTYDFAPTLFNLAFSSTDSDADAADAGASSGSGYSFLTMDILFTNATDIGSDGDCPGTLTQQTCTLRPAVIEYPVMIDTNVSSSLFTSASGKSGSYGYGAMSFDTLSHYKLTQAYTAAVGLYDDDNTTPAVTQTMAEYADDFFGVYNITSRQLNGFNVQSYNDIPANANFDRDESQLAGIELALNMYLGGNASMQYNAMDSYGFPLTQSGNAQQYLTNAPTANQCGFQYANPVTGQTDVLESVMTSINQIMFIWATDMYKNINWTEALDEGAASNYALYPTPTEYNNTAPQILTTVHYVTHQPYMWGAFASMLLCIFLIVPLYWGYWQLGRKVSLGPFEIAHAFRSPMTADAANGTVEYLIDTVGHKKVRFGQITAGDGKGLLGVAEPENVTRVHPNIGSARQEINERMGQIFTQTQTTSEFPAGARS